MLEFWVPGKAQPAGSKRGFLVGGRVVITDANRNAKDWKTDVQVAAIKAMDDHGLEILSGPLSVSFTFHRLRPKSHFLTDGERLSAKGAREEWPTSKPDLLKLARGVEDAMTGIVYRDDSQIVIENLRKDWRDIEGVQVRVQELDIAYHQTNIDYPAVRAE